MTARRLLLSGGLFLLFRAGLFAGHFGKFCLERLLARRERKESLLYAVFWLTWAERDGILFTAFLADGCISRARFLLLKLTGAAGFWYTFPCAGGVGRRGFLGYLGE